MEQYLHTVLIVDDQESVGKDLVNLVNTLGATSVLVESGGAGLGAIKEAPNPFTLIISNQGMPGMKGAEFLREAKQISPDTIRFLSTGFANVDAIADAVNGGSIHRYIAKPWDDSELAKNIEWGFNQYELTMESEKLLKLAKEQNTKLYNLNASLKENRDLSGKTIVDLDCKIKELKARYLGEQKGDFSSEIEALLGSYDLLPPDKLNQFYHKMIVEVFVQLKNIAESNGFEMPGEAPRY